MKRPLTDYQVREIAELSNTDTLEGWRPIKPKRNWGAIAIWVGLVSMFMVAWVIFSFHHHKGGL